ncbi:MAG: hypothetical protein DLM73_09705 [Chthoniobacterales bacterium]|nr:MAG: hypothetical protein DLM73_09705 [Chthoniobacterales bacterium]
MARSNYVSSTDDGFAAQGQTFKSAIGAYAAILNVNPAAVTAQAADADYFSYVVASAQIMQNGARQWTGWKSLTRGGGDLPPSGAPVPPVFPPAVPAVAPGVEARFRALVKQIKAQASYNTAIGEALGIEGSQQTGPDYATLQPDISAAINGTHVDVGWDWSGFANFLDLIEIQVDRNDTKGFVALAFDTTPGYVDTQPFPATPVKWTYQAIYRVGDSRVGQWSKPVSVTVGG